MINESHTDRDTRLNPPEAPTAPTLPIQQKVPDEFEVDRVTALARGFNANLFDVLGIAGITAAVIEKLTSALKARNIPLFEGKSGDCYVQEGDITDALKSELNRMVFPPQHSAAFLRKQERTRVSSKKND